VSFVSVAKHPVFVHHIAKLLLS